MTVALLVWTILIALVTVRAALGTRRGVARPTGSLGRVLLVRPCAGDEPQLERALASSSGWAACVRFAVADETDGAAPTAQKVADRLGAKVVFTRPTQPNRKAAQLARVIDADVEHDIVIVADSDVDLATASIDALLAPLEDPRVGACWAVPVEIEPKTMADRASAAILDASLHSFALLSTLDPRGMVGKLVAYRRSALDAIGGFGAVAAYLGEDMEMARRLQETRVADTTVGSLAQGRTWRAAVARYSRWLQVVRAQRPWLLASYPLLFAATPIVVVLSCVAGDRVSLGLVLASRLGAALAARIRTRRPIALIRLPIDALLADVLLLVSFARAITSRQVVWRQKLFARADHPHRATFPHTEG
jgi:ceramide glucosyltransferase